MIAKRVLVYGGSFDPPHKGHTALLKAGIKFCGADLVYVVPAYLSPLKIKAAVPAASRKRMILAALKESFPDHGTKIKICSYELDRGRITYTYQTLRYLRKLYPRAELFFLGGSDCMETFSRWRRPAEIAAVSMLLIGQRKNAANVGRIRFPYRHKVVPGSFPDVASTELRLGIFATGKIPSLVHDAVSAIIRKNKLYGLDMHAWLKQNLSRTRYYHTLCVVELAQQLALKYGADADAVSVAALLHDAGKDSAVAAPLEHPKLGAAVASKIFGVTDARILSAIKNHTLGREKMNLFDKIIYVADSASRDRNYPQAARIRKQAFMNLDQAFLSALKEKIKYTVLSGKSLHPRGVRVWNAVAGGTA